MKLKKVAIENPSTSKYTTYKCFLNKPDCTNRDMYVSTCIPNTFYDLPLDGTVSTHLCSRYIICSGISVDMIQRLCREQNYIILNLNETSIDKIEQDLLEICLDKKNNRIVLFMDDMPSAWYQKEDAKHVAHDQVFENNIKQRNIEFSTALSAIEYLMKRERIVSISNISDKHIELLLSNEQMINVHNFEITMLTFGSYGMPYLITEQNQKLLWLLSHEDHFSKMLWKADDPTCGAEYIRKNIPKENRCKAPKNMDTQMHMFSDMHFLLENLKN